MVCLFVSCSECSWFVCLNLVGHMLCLCTSIDLLGQWKLWCRSDVGCLLVCFMPRMLIVCCLKLVEVANVFIGCFRSLSAPSIAAAGQARRIIKLWWSPVSCCILLLDFVCFGVHECFSLILLEFVVTLQGRSSCLLQFVSLVLCCT